MTFQFVIGIILIIDMFLCDILIAERIIRFRSVRRCPLLFVEHIVIDLLYIFIYCDVEYELEDLPKVLYDSYFLLPKPLILFVSLCFMIACALGINHEYYVRKTTITPSSITEAISNFNCALSYSEKDGTPILVNRKMEQLAFEICEDRIWNVNDFWTNVCQFEKNDKAEKVHRVVEPVIKISDGSIWNFDRNEIEDKGGTIVEIIAREMKELYNRREELEKENQKLEDIQKELTVTYRNIAEIQQQEELLIYKMRVHDKLGNAIMTSTNSIKDDDLTAEERSTTLSIWKDTLADLKKNAYRSESVGEGSVEDVVKTARALGAEYIIEGSLPVKNPLLAPALREAMYNAIRHSSASIIYARGIHEEDGYRVIISDNGKCSVDKIVERGGLATMRRKIERVGGSMKVEIKESVELTLFFPKENKLKVE